jgi:rubrerythrin
LITYTAKLNIEEVEDLDLSKYSLEDILVSALKAEIDSGAIYTKIGERVKNFMLKERMNFLAGEEAKHREYLDSLYKKKFEGKEPVIPDKTPVPLPAIEIGDENTPLSEVMESAMNAEMAANQFYTAMAGLFENEAETSKMLKYLASMEMGHYKLLEIEKKNALEFEYYDQVWPMMHAGP